MKKLNEIGDWEKVHQVACGEGFEWPAQPPEVPFLNQANVMSIMFVALAVATITGSLILLGFCTRYLLRKCRQTNLVDPTEPIPLSYTRKQRRLSALMTPAFLEPESIRSEIPKADTYPRSYPDVRNTRYWHKKPANLRVFIPPPQPRSPSPDLIFTFSDSFTNGSTPPGPYSEPIDIGPQNKNLDGGALAARAGRASERGENIFHTIFVPLMLLFFSVVSYSRGWFR
jgi:hypothetical protein